MKLNTYAPNNNIRNRYSYNPKFADLIIFIPAFP